MPKSIEKSLLKSAHKQGLKGKEAKKYVYGTMNKLGYMNGNKRTGKK